MGNRATITAKNSKIGIYLHWNGGRDSVTAFLKYCELKQAPSPDRDSYGWSRFCQVVGNFFGGENSLGIDLVENLDNDNGDNGQYIIEEWEIVGRKYFSGEEQQKYNLLEFVLSVDKEQPVKERLGKKAIIKALQDKTK